MGNTECADREPPQLATLLSDRETAQASSQTQMNQLQCSFLLLWSVSQNKSGLILDTPVRLADLQQFDSQSCYLALHLQHLPGNGGSVPTMGNESQGSATELLESSAEDLTPRGLAISFSTLPLEPLFAENRRERRVIHDLYLWSGKKSTDLTKSMALAKAFALERSVQEAEDWTVVQALSRIRSVSLSSVLSWKTSSAPEQQLLKNHLALTLTRTKNSSGTPSTATNLSTNSSPSIITPPANNRLSGGKFSVSFSPTDTDAPAVKKNKKKLPSKNSLPIFRIPSVVVAGSAPVAGEEVQEDDSNVKRLRHFDGICSPILPNLFLGSETTARNKTLLKGLGVTHVLNCAGVICPDFHRGEFVYKTLFIGDGKTEDIACLFYDVLDWFRDAYAQSESNRVLVHCQQGVSRSSAMLILFLMWKDGTPFAETHEKVKRIRGTSSPNTGFIAQLLEWHKRRNRPVEGIRMYRVRPHCLKAKDTWVIKNCIPSASALDPRFGFLIHSSQCVYVWIGQDTPPIAAEKTKAYVERLQRYECAPQSSCVLEQGNEPEEFWSLLDEGHSKRIVSSVPDYDAEFSLIE